MKLIIILLLTLVVGCSNKADAPIHQHVTFKHWVKLVIVSTSKDIVISDYYIIDDRPDLDRAMWYLIIKNKK